MQTPAARVAPTHSRSPGDAPPGTVMLSQAEKGQARTALGAVCEPAGCLHGKMKLSERWLQLDCREIMEKRLTSIKESLK